MGFLLVDEGVLFPDRHTGQSLASQDGLWASSIGGHGSLLEIQAPTPHPRPLESEPALQALHHLRSKGLGWLWGVLRVEGGGSQRSLTTTRAQSLCPPASPKQPPESPGLLDLLRVCVAILAKGVTGSHQEMRIGFAWSPALPFRLSMLSCCFPRSSLQAL